MILYPNAKINIGLNVLEERADGYHEISSVFYPVKGLFDILEIIPSDVFCFTSTGFIIPGEGNICEKAFKLLELDFGISPVKIHLHKQIAIGSGLGGGSANGACTLVALNQIFSLQLSKQQLEQYALQIGADCPFFIDNTPKYVSGIGDRMRSLDLDLSHFDLRVKFSNLHISTEEAYSSVMSKLPEESLLDLINQPIENWKERIENDFETSVFKQYPALKRIKEKLYADGAIYASMSGSGSAFYGIFQGNL